MHGGPGSTHNYFEVLDKVAKTMFDGIRQSKWELFPSCRHMPFVEDNDHYCRVSGEWLDEND